MEEQFQSLWRAQAQYQSVMQLVAGNKRPIGGWDYLSEVIPLEKALYSAAEKTAAEELERPV